MPALVLYYVISALVFRIGAIYFIVKKFLAHDINIQPLHPDKCGGLAPLGAFSLRVTIAGVVAGVCALVGVLANVGQWEKPLIDSANLLTMGGYILGLAVVFFMPLLAARNAMRAAKRRALLLISNEFNSAMDKAMATLGTPSLPSTDVSHIDSLGKLYAVANKMPVYPFNAGNVIKFLTSVLWPLVLLATEWVISTFA